GRARAAARSGPAPRDRARGDGAPGREDPMTLRALLLVATALFSIGIYGLLTRRQAVALLLSIEVMANAANLVFVAFARYGGAPGHPLVLFALAITVAEVAVGLALV